MGYRVRYNGEVWGLVTLDAALNRARTAITKDAGRVDGWAVAHENSNDWFVQGVRDGWRVGATAVVTGSRPAVGSFVDRSAQNYAHGRSASRWGSVVADGYGYDAAAPPVGTDAHRNPAGSLVPYPSLPETDRHRAPAVVAHDYPAAGYPGGGGFAEDPGLTSRDLAGYLAGGANDGWRGENGTHDGRAGHTGWRNDDGWRGESGTDDRWATAPADAGGTTADDGRLAGGWHADEPDLSSRDLRGYLRGGRGEGAWADQPAAGGHDYGQTFLGGFGYGTTDFPQPAAPAWEQPAQRDDPVRHIPGMRNHAEHASGHWNAEGARTDRWNREGYDPGVVDPVIYAVPEQPAQNAPAQNMSAQSVPVQGPSAGGRWQRFGPAEQAPAGYPAAAQNQPGHGTADTGYGRSRTTYASAANRDAGGLRGDGSTHESQASEGFVVDGNEHSRRVAFVAQRPAEVFALAAAWLERRPEIRAIGDVGWHHTADGHQLRIYFRD